MFLCFDLCEWCCIVSHVSLLWYVWVMLYSVSCFFILIERLYSITHTNQSKETRETIQHHSLYNITHTNQSKETWETIQHHSHISKYRNMRDYTTSLTQIKVKEHERLYSITHTYQSKGTWETIQHYSHKSK
jgi:hypothetical protein